MLYSSLEYKDKNLYVNDINLMEVVEKTGSKNFKFLLLPQIENNILKIKNTFLQSKKKHKLNFDYEYAYPTKVCHFYPVLKKITSLKLPLECSSLYDTYLVNNLIERNIIKNKNIIFNGIKTKEYLKEIIDIKKKGFNTICIIDSLPELSILLKSGQNLEIGIRLSNEFNKKGRLFKYSKLGVPYTFIEEIVSKIKGSNLTLKMLHFYIDQGVLSKYFFVMLKRQIQIYNKLRKQIDTLDTINIGGGMPAVYKDGDYFNYQFIIDKIIKTIKTKTEAEKNPFPNIITEFGSYTLSQSGGVVYKVILQKKQSESETWLFLNNSFINTLPDIFLKHQKFDIWGLRDAKKYRVYRIAGNSCDGDDFYSEKVSLPKYKKKKNQYILFMNTAAYQENISGMGGLKHCMIPDPDYFVLDTVRGELKIKTLYSNHNKFKQFDKLLGYAKR